MSREDAVNDLYICDPPACNLSPLYWSICMVSCLILSPRGSKAGRSLPLKAGTCGKDRVSDWTET